MMNIFNKFITNMLGHSSSFISAFYADYLSASASNIGNWFRNVFLSLAWNVVSFVMTIMDILEYVAFSFLGIDLGISDFTALEETFNVDMLTEVFRAVSGLAIVLMLIFTIYAMIKQEWNLAISGFKAVDKDGKPSNPNAKTPFITKILKNIVLIFVMPITIYVIFAGVASVLNSFNTALKQNPNSTVAGQVLATSTYQSNKYRMYANLDQRIPIIIKAYDDSEANYDNIDDMAIKIQQLEVQENLREIVKDLANQSFGSFDSTLVRKNNTIYNTDDFNALHEQFICTPEQYYVMADFVDYAQQNGMTYYIKSIEDESIDWKYVSSVVYKQGSNELTIDYVDAKVINNGYQASAASLLGKDTYSITYTPLANVSTPISDALDSIKAMLGIGEYGDNLYNVMDREENFTNVVTWANEKALIKLSSGIDLSNPVSWTETDQIILYEYYRWKYNNCFRDYTIADLQKGIEWDVQLIAYKEYYESVGIYSQEQYYYCVEFNKNYYIVHLDETNTDMFGNPYYILSEQDDADTRFLSRAYTKIKKQSTDFEVKFSGGFNINNIGGWSFTDEIIIYEYFNDSSYNNSLRKYNIDNFKAGVSLPTYKITNYDENGNETTVNCVLLNKTYYKIEGNSIKPYVSGENLLNPMGADNANLFYHYNVKIPDDFDFSKYGLSVGVTEGNPLIVSQYIKSTRDEYFDLNDTDVDDKKYINYRLKFSSNFDYADISTWSFRDILVFYVMTSDKYQGIKDIDYIKTYGLKANVAKDASGRYFLKISEPAMSGAEYYIMPIQYIEMISEECIYGLNIESTLEQNIFSSFNEDVFVNSGSDDILTDDMDADTYHFEYSDNFKIFNEETWTVGDFILTYCSEMGVIDSISNLRVDGYDALMYKSGTKTYYRFGNDNSTALFLNFEELCSGGSFGVSADDANNLRYILTQKVSQINGYNSVKNKLMQQNPDRDSLYAKEICYRWLRDSANDEYTNDSGYLETIKFSGSFEASNYDTWSQADFILYYMLNLANSRENKQQYISNGYNEARIYNHITKDIHGSTKVTKVIKFNGISNILLNYDVFKELYFKKLAYYDIKNLNVVEYEILMSDTADINDDIIYGISSKAGLATFVWKDYYYYKHVNDYNKLNENLLNVTESQINIIENLDTTRMSISEINLKLNGSPDYGDSHYKFSNSNYKNWTVLEYIVLKEFSSDIEDNAFKSMKFEDLFNMDNYYDLYIFDNSGYNADPDSSNYDPYPYHYIIEINGNYYNLKNYLTCSCSDHRGNPESPVIEVDDARYNDYINCKYGNASCDYDISQMKKGSNSYLNASTAGSYSEKIYKETVSFTVNPRIKYTIDQTEFTVAYNYDDANYYITPHFGTKIAYQVNLNLLDKYSITDVVRKVSWPQKLMNDMLVMYPDLNWNTLIANGNWVDVLGDYVSAYSNGHFVSEGNSGNITAVGMVLSEFFLSCVDESILGYADYEYSSLFDEKIINSLMLSMVGEEDYYALKQQAEIFVELFNTTFAPILDDISAEYSVNIESGGIVDISVFCYKAFLATQLLSSDLGEYLYTVGNRVYAQYTIYESLASAAGKYIEYEQYINGETTSLIVEIAGNYYDITQFAVPMSDDEKFEFNEYVGSVSLAENEQIQKCSNEYKIKIKQAASPINATVVDEILEEEGLLNTPEGLGGVPVKIYDSDIDDTILLLINGKYFNITECNVKDKGDYQITQSIKAYLNSSPLYGSGAKNVLNEVMFNASSYEMMEVENMESPTYKLYVGEGRRGYKPTSWPTPASIDENITILDYLIGLAHGDGHTIDSNVQYSIYAVNHENAFAYSSFKDLVKYENENLGDNAIPMYTFNINKAYAFLYNHYNKLSEGQIGYVRLADAQATPFNTKYTYLIDSDTETTGNKLNDYYEEMTEKGIKIPDYGEGSDAYCYMFEVYYNIKQDCDNRDEDLPNYLTIYKDYLDGTIGRFNILTDADITGGSQFIPNYKSLKTKLTIKRITTTLNYLSLFTPKINYTGRDIDEILTLYQDVDNPVSLGQAVGETFNDVLTAYEGYTVRSVVKKCLSNQFNEHIENVFEFGKNEHNQRNELGYCMVQMVRSFYGVYENPLIRETALSVIGLGAEWPFSDLSLLNPIVFAAFVDVFDYSRDGSDDAWLAILKIQNSLSVILDEMKEVKNLFYSEDTETEKGSKLAEDEYSEDTYNEIISTLAKVYSELSEYIDYQDQIDTAIKTSITFTLGQYGKNYVTNYRFVMEHRGYTFDSMASPLRLAEYTLGGSFLVKYGIYPAFTSEDFDGLVRATKVYDSTDGMLKTNLDMWPELREFASNLAAYTAKLYYNTNFIDMAANVKNAVYITDVLTSDSGGNTTIEYEILNYLVTGCNISAETLCRLMLDGTNINSSPGVADIVNKLNQIVSQPEGVHTITIDDDDANAILSALKNDVSKVHIAFKSVMTYLLLSEEQQEEGDIGIDFEFMTLSDLKAVLMDRLIDYQANASETATENINRYMELLNLICCEVNYYQYSGGSVIKKVTNLGFADVDRQNNGASIAYSGGISESLKFKDDGDSRTDETIRIKFSIDEATKISVLEMAHCENVPTEDLVQMEYESIYSRADGVYDENRGDIFVVCTFDEVISKYIPVLAKNYKTTIYDDAYEDYIDKYQHFINTEYYADSGRAYPIIAKGIITESGLPTAIRIENGKVIFYRTDITATTNIGESAVLNSVYSSELTTLNYTKYVPATLYLPFGDTSKMVKFMGDVNLSTVLKSDLDVFFLQTDRGYILNDVDEFGGFIVLKNITAHYQLDGQTMLLLFMGFVILIPLMWKLSLSAMRRILDIILLVIIFPLVLSMTSLGGNKDSQGEKAFAEWKKKMTQTMLNVFGFIIGFNCYYILISTVLRMDFVSVETYRNITSIGGMNFISLSTINMLVKYLFILQAVAMIQGTMSFLLPMVTGGSATNALISAVDGQEPAKQLTKLKNDLKEAKNKAVGIINGEALIQLRDATIESAKSMIPGSQVMASMKDNVQDITNKFKANAMKNAAIARGVPPSVAKKFAKEYQENKKKERTEKRQRHLDNANKFMSTYMSDYGVNQPFSQNVHMFEKGPEKAKKNKAKKKNNKPKNKTSTNSKDDDSQSTDASQTGGNSGGAEGEGGMQQELLEHGKNIAEKMQKGSGGGGDGGGMPMPTGGGE